MKRMMIAVLAIALVAAPGLLATSFALQRASTTTTILLRCKRDWFGRLKVRQFDSRNPDIQLGDLPRSCADALALLLSDSGEFLTALPSGFNGVLYVIKTVRDRPVDR
jgi:hypothetical protein